MEGIQTFKCSWPWPWPWIWPYGIPSCITHRPLPTYQISLKSKKLFVNGRTDGHFPPSNIIRSTFESRPKNLKSSKNLTFVLQVLTVLENKILNVWKSIKMKNESEETQHCALVVVERSQKFPPAADLVPGGVGRPKFNQLGWSLPSPTNPVWWGSMHAILSYRGNRSTNKHTDSGNYNAMHCTAA